MGIYRHISSHYTGLRRFIKNFWDRLCSNSRWSSGWNFQSSGFRWCHILLWLRAADWAATACHVWDLRWVLYLPTRQCNELARQSALWNGRHRFHFAKRVRPSQQSRSEPGWLQNLGRMKQLLYQTNVHHVELMQGHSIRLSAILSWVVRLRSHLRRLLVDWLTDWLTLAIQKRHAWVQPFTASDQKSINQTIFNNKRTRWPLTTLCRQ